MKILAVLGSKGSGKTTIIECLVKGLKRKGYKIATIKHIPEPDFTIDKKGKDTWRHGKAGAVITISVAPKELAIIKRINTETLNLKELVNMLQQDAEIVLLEGFRKLTGQNSNIPKIVAVKSTNEAKEAYLKFNLILAFVGLPSTEPLKLNIPYVNVLENPEKLVEIVTEHLMKNKEIETEEEKDIIEIQVHGKVLSLNPFVKKIIRNTVLAMISVLKNVTIKGDETVTLIVKNQQ